MVKMGQMEESQKGIVGHLMWVCTRVAEKEKLSEGYRLVINNGLHGCKSPQCLYVCQANLSTTSISIYWQGNNSLGHLAFD